MKISTKGQYALRLMMDIAAHDQAGLVSLKDVAARENLSMKYLEQIAGILEAMEKRGLVADVHDQLRRGRADIRCRPVEEGPVLAAFDTVAGGLRVISKSYRKNVRFWG